MRNKRAILSVISIALIFLTGCSYTAAEDFIRSFNPTSWTSTAEDWEAASQQKRIKEIDEQIQELLEQKDDLYAIKTVSEGLFKTDAAQVNSSNGALIIWDENHNDITDQYSDNEDFIRLKGLLEEYAVIYNVHPDKDATILMCTHLDYESNGVYDRQIVITSENLNEDTVENYYASPAPREYEKEVSDGVVVWNYDNGADYKESVRARRIYDDVWSFEKIYRSGILDIFTI